MLGRSVDQSLVQNVENVQKKYGSKYVKILDYIHANDVGVEAVSVMGSLVAHLQHHRLWRAKVQLTLASYFDEAHDV